MAATSGVIVDGEFIKWFATLGVGGVLAAFMFFFYRKDVSHFTEQWKMATEQFMVIVKDNTASNVELISLIKMQDRNALRKDDIKEMIERRVRSEP